MKSSDAEQGFSRECMAHLDAKGLRGECYQGQNPYLLYPTQFNQTHQDPFVHRVQDEIDRQHRRMMKSAMTERRIRLTAYVSVVVIAILLLFAFAVGAIVFFRANPELLHQLMTGESNKNNEDSHN